LQIGELLLFKGNLSNLQLDVARTSDAWDLKLKADQLDGSVKLPDNPRRDPVKVQLKSLRLDLDHWLSDDGDLESGAPAADEIRPDPRQAPGLDVMVEKFYIGEQELGQLDFMAVPVADGVHLEQLELTGPRLTLQGSGAWSGTPERQKTRLSFEAQTPDLGRLTRELQFTSAVEQAEMAVQAQLQWAAPPTEVALENLQGSLDFQVGKGRVVDVEPGMGRIFGLLNLGALQRRLTLDFTDLFGEGYAFDSIKGRFDIGDGVAQARQVTITGPGADMEISGKTGLVSRDYDQLVTVTPEISATLPLAGALVGGPLAAAVLVVADQVVGEEVNKLISIQYRLTGPWDDPQIERIESEGGQSGPNAPRSVDGNPRKVRAGPFAEGVLDH